MLFQTVNNKKIVWNLKYKVYDKIMPVKVTKINPPGSACPQFKAVSDQPLTEKICMDLQIQQGYNPAGYGFHKPQFTKDGNNFIAVWSCDASCD